jgi:hypothetical protein
MLFLHIKTVMLMFSPIRRKLHVPKIFAAQIICIQRFRPVATPCCFTMAELMDAMQVSPCCREWRLRHGRMQAVPVPCAGFEMAKASACLELSPPLHGIQFAFVTGACYTHCLVFALNSCRFSILQLFCWCCPATCGCGFMVSPPLPQQKKVLVMQAFGFS